MPFFTDPPKPLEAGPGDYANWIENQHVGAEEAFVTQHAPQIGASIQDVAGLKPLAEQAPFDAAGNPNPDYADVGRESNPLGKPTPQVLTDAQKALRPVRPEDVRGIIGNRKITVSPFDTYASLQAKSDQTDADAWRAWIADRRNEGTGEWLLNGAASFGTALTDPLSYIPMGGEAWRTAVAMRGLGKAAQYGLGAAIGAGEMVGIGAAALPLQVSGAKAIDDDVTYASALHDLLTSPQTYAVGGLAGMAGTLMHRMSHPHAPDSTFAGKPPSLTATPEELAAVAHVESGGNPDAVSSAGAVGRMQVMPAAARDAAKRLGASDLEGLSDEQVQQYLKANPAAADRLGSTYYQMMLEKYDGNRTLARAAYNAGEGNVNKWIAEHGDPRTGAVSEADWVAKVPYRETRDYVGRVAAAEGGSSFVPTHTDIVTGRPVRLDVSDGVVRIETENGHLTTYSTTPEGMRAVEAKFRPIAEGGAKPITPEVMGTEAGRLNAAIDQHLRGEPVDVAGISTGRGIESTLPERTAEAAPEGATSSGQREAMGFAEYVADQKAKGSTASEAEMRLDHQAYALRAERAAVQDHATQTGLELADHEHASAAERVARGQPVEEAVHSAVTEAAAETHVENVLKTESHEGRVPEAEPAGAGGAAAQAGQEPGADAGGAGGHDAAGEQPAAAGGEGAGAPAAAEPAGPARGPEPGGQPARASLTPASLTPEQLERSAERVGDEITRQLVASGMSLREAAPQAALWKSFFEAIGGRAGVDPWSLFQGYRVAVQRGGKAEADALLQRTLRSTELVRPIDELVRSAESQKDWKDWYDRHDQTLGRLFGEDAPLFQKILSATSQAASVKSNVGLALKAFGQLKRGEPFTGYLPAVIKNLERVRSDEELAGAKIGQYGKANEGDKGAIAVDRHIAMLLFDTKSPSGPMIRKAQETIREIADKLGWEPRQVQASLWAYNQVRLGTDPLKVESYDKILERRAVEIDALRSSFNDAGGEGAGVQGRGDPGARGEEGQGGAGAEAGAPVEDLFQIKAYHGSPHTFDRFDIGKIGAGEGNQTYGHGLYFAESEGVAKSYHTLLAGGAWHTNEGKVDYLALARQIRSAIEKADPEFGRQQSMVRGITDNLLSMISQSGSIEAAVRKEKLESIQGIMGKGYAAAIEKARELGVSPDKGAIYTVHLDVDHGDLLDLDKPMGEHGQAVMEKLRALAADLEAHDPGSHAARDIRSGKAHGSTFYHNLTSDLSQDIEGSDPARASAALREAGIPGIRYLDGGSRGGGEGTHNVVIFDDSKVKITHRNGEELTPKEKADVLFQMKEGQSGGFSMSREARMKRAEARGETAQPRGSISFGEDGKTVIRLFQQADASTFLHESAHFFMRVLRDLGEREGMPEDLSNDWKTLRDWLGVKDGEALGVEHEEKLARGFESYLRDGKAPTSALRQVFETIKDWLHKVYQSLSDLGVLPSPEVKGVFDRMLGGDPEALRTAVAARDDPLAEQRALLARPEPKVADPLAEPDYKLDYDVMLAAGHIGDEARAEVDSATAELERAQKLEPAYRLAASCALGVLMS